MRAITVLLGLSTTLIAFLSPVAAHPGHGTLPLPAESMAHYSFEPTHMLPALGGGLLMYFAIRWIGGCRWRQRAARK